MRTGLGRYILVGHTPVLCEDPLIWAYWMETANRRVALDEIGGREISTVFLGIDHGPALLRPDHDARRRPRPVLFETMTFSAGGESEGLLRYCTWEEAEEGHRAQCAALRTKQAAPRQ
jgi:hypothetical protein